MVVAEDLQEMKSVVVKYGEPEETQKETTLLRLAQGSPHVVEYRDSVVVPPKLHGIVLEYLQSQASYFDPQTLPELKAYIKGISDLCVALTFIIIIIISGYLEGLRHLHSLDIVHRDVKVTNALFVPHRGTVIIDFELAMRLRPETKYTFVGDTYGTPGMRAPELLLGSADCTFSVDLWSIGAVTLQLVRIHHDLRISP